MNDYILNPSLRADIYVNAAKRLAWYATQAKYTFTRGCCAAIRAECPRPLWQSLAYLRYFENIISPMRTNDCAGYWYGDPQLISEQSMQDLMARTLGLLLVAEILKDEQKEQK